MSDRRKPEPSPINTEQAAAFLGGRRSIDAFTAEQPDPAIVRAAVDAARWAPNHHLTEPWRFYVLGPQTQEAIVELNGRLTAERKDEEVAELKRERWRGMPGWVAITCQTEADPLLAQEDYAACACAIENLMLYLHAAGLGSKWISGEVTRHDELPAIIGYDPASAYCVGIVWYGYPKRRPRSQRTDLANVLFERP